MAAEVTETSLSDIQNNGRLLHCGSRPLDISCPKIMAVLNTTPDSFSDGGDLFVSGSLSLDKVLHRVELTLDQGAVIIDVGGESTRPGAVPVTLQEEMDRVLPVVEAINRRFDTIISVDSSSPELMLEAASLGAGLLNDVRALQREGALQAAAATGLPVCLMHMKGQPETMQHRPDYQKDVVVEVASFLKTRVTESIQNGIKPENILLDPGFGFGKTVAHNLRLLNQLPQLVELGYPVLVGLSRKSMIGKILNREVDQRLAGSLALALLAAERGASIIRVHDVQETADVLTMLDAVNNERDTEG